MIIAIDGHSSCGKSTIAKGIAKGIAEGKAEGKAEELKEKYKSWVTLSNNLKKRGMSNPEIAALLGVPETELQDAFKMIKEEKNIK
jgi:ABC-type dipeptide/oligopeptide/nickel transport system ATPase component